MKRRINAILLLNWLLVTGMAAQSLVTGVVKETSGETLPGVSVYVKGTTTGTITDIEGVYQVQVASGQTLVFSFIGFQTQEVVVADHQKIDVVLEAELKKLDEVVVTGYTTQSRAEMTTSIS